MIRFSVIKLPIIIIFSIISCNKIFEPVEQAGEGLCIYPTKVEYTTDLSYQKINIEDVSISGKPIISYNPDLTVGKISTFKIKQTVLWI